MTDILDDASFIDPLNTGGGLNRAAVTQSFQHIQSGEELTVSVNHLKSKGSLSGDPADTDQGDGQGNNNATRAEAAKILADHLATNPTGVDTGNVLILGDLNAYAQEDPVTSLEADGFTDLAYDQLGAAARSYVFDGMVGTLDYIMGSQDVLNNVTGVTEWHINADEADAIDYQDEVRSNDGDFLFIDRTDNGTDIFDGTTAARNSDHDPVIVGFQFDAPTVIAGDSGSNDLRGTDDLSEVFRSEGGFRDVMRNSSGDDTDYFLIGGQAADQNRDNDLILFFDYLNDILVLESEAVIERYDEAQDYVKLYFEDSADSVKVRGSGVDFANLTIAHEDDFVFI